MKRFDQTFLFKQHLYTIKAVILVWLLTGILPIHNVLSYIFMSRDLSVRLLVSIIYLILLLCLTLFVLIKQRVYLSLANKAYDAKIYSKAKIEKGRMSTFLGIHTLGVKDKNGFLSFTFLSNEELIDQLSKGDLCIYILSKSKKLILIDVISENKKVEKHE